LRLRTGRGRERGEQAAAPATVSSHPAPSLAPPSPGTQTQHDSEPTLLHPSLTRVLVAIRDLPLHQEVLDFVTRDGRIDVIGALTDASQFRRGFGDMTADAVICCPTLAADVAGPSQPRLRERSDGLAPRVYLVGQELTIPVLRQAIATGVTGAYRWPEERDALGDQLGRRRLAAPTSEGSRGWVVAVHGARGGAGTTFVACQLAASLATRGVATSLMDAGLAFSDVTAALGVPMDAGLRTIADLIPVVDEVSVGHLTKVLHPHPAGFSALLGPTESSDVDSSHEGALVRAALIAMMAAHRVVLVHTPRSMDAATRAALELADAVLLVTALDLFSLYGAKRIVKRLGLLGSDRLHVVVNRAARSGIGIGDVERVLGRSPLGRIRVDPAVPRAQERGELLRPRSGRAARDVDRLAERLLDLAPHSPTEAS
jgi:Flp pilus assembly CpaE family ATPase